MKLVALFIILLLVVCLSVYLALPVFAQTHIASEIQEQPFSSIAARQIITNSGLPMEVLPGGITNEITRGRDVVNAYRYAHGQLGKNGWYRGLSKDHTPLLVAMVNELEKQGFTSSKVVLQDKSAEVLQKFWYASDTENAKELGYNSQEEMDISISNLTKSGKQLEVSQLISDLERKWK